MAQLDSDQKRRLAIKCNSLIIGAVTVFVLAMSRTTLAATIMVDSLADPGAPGICVLRDAITAANTKKVVNGCGAGDGTDTINFHVSGTITLTLTDSSGFELQVLPDIQNRLTIDGVGQSISITIASNWGLPGAPLLTVDSGAIFAINHLTFTNIFDAQPTFGGVIYSSGALTIRNSTFSHANAYNGGVIFSNEGGATIYNSTFSDNDASVGGGAIYISSGTVLINNSTFSGNSAGGYPSLPGYNGGGAIQTRGGTLIIQNSTFADNRAVVGSDTHAVGGAIDNSGELIVNDSTFSGNIAPPISGGGIENEISGTARISTSILANSVGWNCRGDIIEGGHNISDDSSCNFGSSTGVNGKVLGDEISSSDLALDPHGLANNGGPTETIALEPGSYAIGAIPVADCPPTDQRFSPRPAPANYPPACDIGAYELQCSNLSRSFIVPELVQGVGCLGR